MMMINRKYKRKAFIVWDSEKLIKILKRKENISRLIHTHTYIYINMFIYSIQNVVVCKIFYLIFYILTKAKLIQWKIHWK